MKTQPLGGTAVLVSRIALGCGNFGGIGSPARLIGRGLDREASFAALDEAVALGVNLIDTAHSYAGGSSERFIGEWLSARPPALRSTIHIATKVGTELWTIEACASIFQRATSSNSFPPLCSE